MFVFQEVAQNPWITKVFGSRHTEAFNPGKNNQHYNLENSRLSF